MSGDAAAPARAFRLAWAGALLGGLLALLWIAGLMRFATLIPDRLADDASPTEAVVVLTGGSGRLDTGLDLLARAKAEKLFVSGVYRGLDVQRLLQLARRDPAEIEARIALGDAVNTQANARETAAWMKAEGFRSLRLVTGAYHMPRSLLEFRHAIPEATVIPHPVFPDHVKADWWAWPGTLGLVIGEYNKYLFAWTWHRLKDAAATFPGERARAVSDQVEPAAPEGFRGAGRSGAKRVAVPTGEPRDEPAPRKAPALRVAPWRAPAALRRSADAPASTPRALCAQNIKPASPAGAPRLAGRLARTQRRRFNLVGYCSEGRP